MSYFDGDEQALQILKDFDERLSESIILYVDYGTEMGSFLTAVFSNDLFRSFKTVCTERREQLKKIISFIHWHCPGDCHGSAEIVKNWISNKKSGLK